MRPLTSVLFILALSATTILQAQTDNDQLDIEQIKKTLLDYIEGTANGDPERLKNAFHPDFNLYTIRNDSLIARFGERYISNIKQGKKSNRIGKIISIDFTNDAAIAKSEIEIPNWRLFTDYFLLMKYHGSWKIVQKSYTYKELPDENKQE